MLNEFREIHIYTITCKNKNELCYVGQTVNFKERIKQHKYSSKFETNKLYKKIREYGGWNQWKMEKIDTYIYKDKQNNEIEQYWIFKKKANLNTVSPNKKMIYDDNLYFGILEKLEENKKSFN